MRHQDCSSLLMREAELACLLEEGVLQTGKDRILNQVVFAKRPGEGMETEEVKNRRLSWPVKLFPVLL